MNQLSFHRVANFACILTIRVAFQDVHPIAPLRRRIELLMGKRCQELFLASIGILQCFGLQLQLVMLGGDLLPLPAEP